MPGVGSDLRRRSATAPAVWTFYRPKGENRIAQAFRPGNVPKENRPERGGRLSGVIPKENARRKQADGVSGRFPLYLVPRPEGPNPQSLRRGRFTRPNRVKARLRARRSSKSEGGPKVTRCESFEW